LVAAALRYADFLLLLFFVTFLWWEMCEEISLDFRGFAKEWTVVELLDIGCRDVVGEIVLGSLVSRHAIVKM
jgi:hypothetical protein